MKQLVVFATSYPYTAGVLAIIWIGSAILLRIDGSLSFNLVLVSNIIVSLIVASVGFRK